MVRVAIVVACCAALGAGDMAAQEPGSSAGPPTREATGPQVDDILINLRMGRISERLVTAAQRAETPFLPVVEFLEMAELRFVDGGEGVLHAIRQPGALDIVLDAPTGHASLDGRAISGAADALLWRDGRILASPKLLEELLGVSIHTNFSDLHAVVMNPEVLPLGRRMERERRRARIAPAEEMVPADRTLGRTRYRAGGAVLDWSTSFDPSQPGRTAHLSLGTGAQLLGGSLQLSARSLGAVADGVFHTGASYQIAWPERSWLRQLRIGDGLGSGPRPRSLRGIHLTNAPYVRQSHFGSGEITGRLGPGWEVELRQQGRTIDMTRANEQGAFALDVPLSYGTNPVEVVAWGAHGEVVTMDRVVMLRQDRLPAGRFEWGLSAGECRSAACVSSGNLDLRYGLTDQWTLRAGTDGFVRDTLPDAVHPYLEISGAPTSSVHLSVEGVLDGFVRGVAEFMPSGTLRLRGAHTRFQKGLDAPALHDARRVATTEADLQWRPLGTASRWTLSGSMVHELRDTDQRFRFQTASRMQLGGYRVELGLRSPGAYRPRDPAAGSDSGRSTLSDPTVDLRPVLSLRGGLPLPSPTSLSPWILAEIESARADSLVRAQFRVNYPLARDTQLNLTASWDAATGHRLTAGLQATFDQIRSVTQLLGGAHEETRTVQYAQGSIQWNEATGGVHLDSGTGTERAGLSGWVFLDENGNGRRDPAEPALSGVRVLVEGRAVETDAGGRYAIWDLVPWEMTRVELDPLSIPNPLWVSSLGTVDLPLTPSSYRRLDLPVVPGQEIGGRVVRIDAEGREVPVPGLEILVVDLLRPDETFDVTTFSDGGFYALGLRPGAYEFRVPPELLDHIELRQDHPDRAIVVRPNGDRSADRVTIRLAPRAVVTVSPR